MFGLAASASPGIVSEPLARASREDVAMRFDAGSLKLWTARSSKQTALSSASSSFSDKASLCTCAISPHAEVSPRFAGMISCCAVLSRFRAMRAKVSR